MKTLHLIIIAVLTVSVLTPAFADTVTVDMPEGTGVPGCQDENACFVPYKVTIDVGYTVTWQNSDTVLHFVTAGDLDADPNTIGLDYPNGFDSGLLMTGETFSHTFNNAGIYPYFCAVHPWMKGIVYVENTNQNQNIPTNTNPIIDTVTAGHLDNVEGQGAQPSNLDECKPHYKIVTVGLERFCLKMWLTDMHCHDDGTQFAASLSSGMTYCIDHESNPPVKYKSLQAGQKNPLKLTGRLSIR